jgi:hypothetical protein
MYRYAYIYTYIYEYEAARDRLFIDGIPDGAENFSKLVFVDYEWVIVFLASGTL